MEMALLLKEGVKQVILTPQTKAERKLLEVFDLESGTIEVKRGSFYSACAGGWHRQFQDDSSVMLIMRERDGGEVSND